ncbi:hypothetical protein MMC25_006318 [Agyrium rufum]|nr:hypothetical protein [Agyrium rufum]
MADLYLEDLERQRNILEESIEKLRKSLQYWQLWEIEYEGLKEEIEKLGSRSTQRDLEQVGDEYGGTLLKGKDVQENLKTIEKRINAESEKLLALVPPTDMLVQDDAGLPMTEIREELDDDGNIILSTTFDPSADTAQLVETLRKAGVKDLSEDVGSVTQEGQPTSRQIKKIKSPETTPRVEESQLVLPNGAQASKPNSARVPKGPPVQNEVALPAANTEYKRKKSVTFAEDIDIAPQETSRQAIPKIAHQNPLKDVFPPEKGKVAMQPSQASPTTLKGSPTRIEILEDDSPISSPVIPATETVEDAALRRQMLEYSMNEVSAIVAEIELDDESESYETISDEFDEDEDENEELITEDEHGRTITRVLSDEYKAQMLALERRLNAHMTEHVGPDGGVANVGAAGEKMYASIGQSKVPSTVSGKRGVHFAEDLEKLDKPISASNATEDAVPEARPVADAIIEREPTVVQDPSIATTKRVSKFKSGRTKLAPPPSIVATRVPQISPPIPVHLTPSPAQPSVPVPTGPPSSTHANVIERAPPSSESNTEVPHSAPDEFDPALMNQELAVEYHKMRNRMIHRQGGFVQAGKNLEQEDEEMDEDEFIGRTDGGKKLSQFRAARLANTRKP